MMATRSCAKARMGCRRKSWWATTAAPLANTSCRWKPSPPITPGRSTSATRSCPIREAFATAYLDAFREQFLHIQGDYRKRRRAFDTLFKHCKYDPGGSFAYRWECVLRRLDQTNPYALVEAIRQHIWVLNREPAQPDAPHAHSAGPGGQALAWIFHTREAGAPACCRLTRFERPKPATCRRSGLSAIRAGVKYPG